MFSALAVGHSHLAAISRALAKSNSSDFNVQLMSLRGNRLGKLWKRNLHGHEVLTGKLRRIVKNGIVGRDCLILTLGGSAHNLVGLINHPRPFDFVLTEQPSLPLLEASETIPEDIVREAIRVHLVKWFPLMRAFIRSVDVPILHPESPPPIPSDEFIVRYPGAFQDKVHELGVASVTLRYKLWRLHSELVRTACLDAGMEFVPVPGEAVDESGYLIKRAWGHNATHAGAWYGGLVLRQIAHRLQETQQTQ